jgi:glucosylceramidase
VPANGNSEQSNQNPPHTFPANISHGMMLYTIKIKGLFYFNINHFKRQNQKQVSLNHEVIEGILYEVLVIFMDHLTNIREMNTMLRAKQTMTLSIMLCFIFLYNGQAQVKWIQSTTSDAWTIKEADIEKAGKNPADIIIYPGQEKQTVDGFGVCFNELGWTALSVLGVNERETVLKSFFDPVEGINLNICRMPIGANDYARNYYSLNDSAGDFEMKYFTISRDREILIPYIKSAMKYKPDLKIWASPWTPPIWMKTNNHYACHPDVVNDMTPDQAGHEGLTQFRMQPQYLEAYALYFSRAIQAYRNEGINLTGIHVQNEMNSCQNFPSCIWTAKDLGIFIGKYLGPKLKKDLPDAEIWYGTVERPSVEKLDTILQDPVTSQYIAGISFQWAGKQAIPGVRVRYPQIKLMQSETECGDGSNDWKAAEYTFSLMKHYFDHGVSVYTFWNSILDETGKSMWGWKQNSMVTVNSKTHEINYHPEYYLLKHFSYFVEPGARLIGTEGSNQEVLAFLNSDKSIVIIIGNTKDDKKELKIIIGDKLLNVSIEGHSFNTFLLQ